jgi:hypothetical protein
MKRIPKLAAIDREIGLRGSFYDFVKMAWPLVEHGRPFVDNWHIGAVCEHLEAVYRGQVKNLVINIPPGCMKSLTTSVLWDPWCWIQDPGYRFIYGSFDESLVGKRDGDEGARHREVEVVPGALGRPRHGQGQGPFDQRVLHDAGGDALRHVRRRQGARPARQRVRGRRSDEAADDDDAHARRDVALEAGDVGQSRLLPGGAFVLIMQRLHERDMAGRCEEEGGYEFLRLPMRFEEEQRCTTSIGFVDPRKEEGELLWPAYKNEAEVSQQEKDMGGGQRRRRRAAAAASRAREGPHLRADWFQYWTRSCPRSSTS